MLWFRHLAAGGFPLLAFTSFGHAAFTLPGDAMSCTRSATLLNCTNRLGNHYRIVQRSNDTLMHGFDAISAQTWAQTSTTYCSLA